MTSRIVYALVFAAAGCSMMSKGSGSSGAGGAGAGAGAGGGGGSPTSGGVTGAGPEGEFTGTEDLGGDNRDRCGVGDYHQTPFFDWKGCSGGRDGYYDVEFSSRCRTLNKFYGTRITCRYDKPSFEAYYGKQAKKPRNSDRDQSNPDSYCGMFGLREVTGGDQTTGAHVYLEKDPVKAEFAAKVKTITCAYDADLEKSPRLELHGDDLVIYVRGDWDDGGTGGVGHGSEWAVDGLMKAFPSFKAAWTEYH